MTRIAIYDLDNTLTQRATFTPFLLFAARRIAPWRTLLAPVWIALMAGYRAGLYDRTALKTRGMRLMTGAAPLPRLEELGRAFAAGRALSPAVLRLLEQDRADGARIVIATAAFQFYAAAFAERLGIDAVLGTQWDGRTIPGGNCYGAEKAARVSAWLEAEGIARGEASLRMVTDSFADAPVMDMADDPVFVTASPAKARRARARGWRVIAPAP